MTKWRCTVCGYIYDPEKGDPAGDIPPGSAFEDISGDWTCPSCGSGLICASGKEVFEKVD